MTPSNDLFDLLRSLTPQEKKFLTTQLTVPDGDESVYKKLYDAIERQNEYDEQKIKRQLSKTINERSFPVIKNRLFHIILDKLRVFYTDDLPDFIVRQMIEKAIILNDKKRTDAAWKMIKTAKELALSNELFPEAIRALDRERKIIQFLEIEAYERSIKENLALEKATVEKHTNLTEYVNLDSKMFSIYKRNLIVRNKEEVDFFKELLKHPLLQDESSALSFRAKYYFFHIKSSCFYCLGEMEKSYVYAQMLIATFESAPIANHEIGMLLHSLQQMTNIQGALGKLADLMQSINKIRDISKTYPRLAKNIPPYYPFKFSVVAETDLYLRIPDFAAGVALVPRIESELKKFGYALPKNERYVVYYNITLLYFGAGDYHKTLLWVNKILNENKEDYVLDLICGSRILFLIAHIELGNDDLLQYAAQSTQRYLTTRKRKYKVETIFLDLLKLLLDPGRKKELLGIYPQLLDEFKTLMIDPYERGAFEYFDFISWCESKIQDRAFGEVVLEKANFK